MKERKRHEILDSAMELFAMKGFRGTTTRDLAAAAGVNEAIIFRHFNTKQELYRAILEEKLIQMRAAPFTDLEALAKSGDDQKFLEAVGLAFLERHEHDTTFMRLLLFSALEGHELADMFLTAMAGRDPMALYLERRMDEGALRRMDPHLAAHAFFGMFISFVQWQEIFGLKKTRAFDPKEVVRTFVTTFLTGVKA
jgi:AcrR family transcriptional regulator